MGESPGLTLVSMELTGLVNDLNTEEDIGANGTATAALIFGGSSPARDETEEWNGASWSETSDLNTGKKN